MSAKRKKIAVLFGGLSSEKEVSVETGRAFIKALIGKGHTVVPIAVGRDVARDLLKERQNIEAAVIGLHGKLGEDGCIQGLCESMGIPYTGSGVMASAIAMHKVMTKNIAACYTIQTPAFDVCDLKKEAIGAFEQRLTLPVVMKAVAEGSSRGTSIVKQQKDVKAAIEEAARYDSTIFAEKFIEGPQVTAPILNGKCLPLIEIVPKEGFYSYQAKYTKGLTEYILPARVSEKTAKIIADNALKIYQVLGCRGCARADFMVDLQGRPWFIEINTLPGMTETSLVPMAAAQEGILFDDLVEKILSAAALDHEKIFQI